MGIQKEIETDRNTHPPIGDVHFRSTRMIRPRSQLNPVLSCNSGELIVRLPDVVNDQRIEVEVDVRVLDGPCEGGLCIV
jgi:hypothetical protein